MTLVQLYPLSLGPPVMVVLNRWKMPGDVFPIPTLIHKGWPQEKIPMEYLWRARFHEGWSLGAAEGLLPWELSGIMAGETLWPFCGLPLSEAQRPMTQDVHKHKRQQHESFQMRCCSLLLISLESVKVKVRFCFQHYLLNRLSLPYCTFLFPLS